MLLVVPSRGRPQNIARLMDAISETCRADVSLVIGLDWDDPTIGGYPGMVEIPDHLERDRDYVFPAFGLPSGYEYEVRPGLRQVVAWINALAVPRAAGFRCVGHIGDDNVPRTVGWDVDIMEALEKTPFAFGNDLYPGRVPGSLCCHVFMRSEVIAALGYMGPPSIRHMYVDVAWYAWGQACGITYLHDVIIDHMHYTAGKAPADASYTASTALIPADLAAYQAYCADPGGLNADIARIANAMGISAEQFTPEATLAFNTSLNIPQAARPDWVPGMPLWP